MDLEYLSAGYGKAVETVCYTGQQIRGRVNEDLNAVDRALCPTTTDRELRALSDELETEESLNRRFDPLRQFAKRYCERRMRDQLVNPDPSKAGSNRHPADD